MGRVFSPHCAPPHVGVGFAPADRDRPRALLTARDTSSVARFGPIDIRASRSAQRVDPTTPRGRVNHHRRQSRHSRSALPTDFVSAWERRRSIRDFGIRRAIAGIGPAIRSDMDQPTSGLTRCRRPSGQRRRATCAPRPCRAGRATSISRLSGSGRCGAGAGRSRDYVAKRYASSWTGSTSGPSRMRGRTQAARPTRPASTSAPSSHGPGSRS